MSRAIETYTPQALAKQLVISPKTIYRALKSGELPCVRYNRKTITIQMRHAVEWYNSKGGRIKSRE